MGERAIAPMGHVRMMAAAQPFLSGAISKTVNLPETATVEEIEDIYFQGWKLGLKALAVYRDNCKVGQPLSDGKAQERPTAAEADGRRRSSSTARSASGCRSRARRTTTSFTVGGAEGYMTAGSYPDDGLGEVFLKLGKQGSTLAGVMDAFSIAISIALQYGVPLETYVQKFTNMRFEPAGLTDDPDIRMAQSMMDYIFRRLALDYLPFDDARRRSASTPPRSAPRQARDRLVRPSTPTSTRSRTSTSRRWRSRRPIDEPPSRAEDDGRRRRPRSRSGEAHSSAELLEPITGTAADAPLCLTCGTKMRPAGSCYVCEGCGSTSGCS